MFYIFTQKLKTNDPPKGNTKSPDQGKRDEIKKSRSPDRKTEKYSRSEKRSRSPRQRTRSPRSKSGLKTQRGRSRSPVKRFNLFFNCFNIDSKISQFLFPSNKRYFLAIKEILSLAFRNSGIIYNIQFSISHIFTNRKLTDEEKKKRLEEMMQNAQWREDQRKSNVKRYTEEDRKEEEALRSKQEAEFLK